MLAMPAPVPTAMSEGVWAPEDEDHPGKTHCSKEKAKHLHDS